MEATLQKQIHEALVNAVPYLAKPGGLGAHFFQEYICFAIESGNKDAMSRITYGGIKARETISERLWPNNSLDGWLSRQGIPDEKLTWNNMQRHRHAWLKQLIEEFSK